MAITPIAILTIKYIMFASGIVVTWPFQKTIFILWFIYYYLGLGLGNKIIKIKAKNEKLILIYIVSIVLTIAEGVLWFKGNNFNMATTQLRLTQMIASVVALLIAYKFINNNEKQTIIH